MTTFKAIDGTWSFGSTSYDEAVERLQERGSGHIEVLMDGEHDMDVELEDVDHWRQCSVCGALVCSGYFVEAEFSYEYYCSEQCLHEKYTEEEYNEMYEEDTAFWTDWI